jgi:TFIIF-interacting CTD phosphatase-like protein
MQNSTPKKKYNILLDLDNTLISAVPLEEFPTDNKTKLKALKFKYVNMEDYYIIFQRPYLQRFLTFIFKHFNVSVWSAASKDYVLFIIENVILKNHPERKLDYIFFSYHCNWSKSSKKIIKNLEMLWDEFGLSDKFQRNNTFIIDDLSEVTKNQPCNSIQVKEFEFLDNNSEKDKDLKRVGKKLKNLLKLDLPEDEDICLTTSF